MTLYLALYPLSAARSKLGIILSGRFLYKGIKSLKENLGKSINSSPFITASIYLRQLV
jgi:hypothetical protein